MKKTIYIANEKLMLKAGAEIARQCQPGDVIFLEGELGAGKTTLTRGLLRELGYSGIVKSPTYTLVETYHLDNKTIHHFDLYRLHDPEELLAIGLRDYLSEDAICLIEWPERAASILPNPKLYCKIEIPQTGDGRIIMIESKEN